MITSRPFTFFDLSTRLRARRRVRQAVLFAVAIAIALPGLPASASVGTNDLAKFSGRADRVGETDRTGGLRWEARFEAPRPDSIDLSSGARVFIGGALTELDGTSLFSIDGFDVSTIPLEAARNARADRSKFEFAGRDRSGTRAQVTWRNGRLKIKLQSGRAHLQAPAACVGGASEAVLRSTVAVEIPGLPRQEFTATQPWKCSSRRSCDGCFDLRAKMRRTGGSGPAGNRPPQASLRFENLTRDRDAANWIRLDARGSEDRDGTIASYEYAISSRSDGRSLEAPGQTMSPVAHVELSPGDYEVRVTVTDDQGQRGTEVRNLSISG
ncbi:MAG: PKD domain-containing protein, partial [Candidatus Binatia bacterium]|nr:PKD domain-containing protein [Candidatus Binatia bacterium]